MTRRLRRRYREARRYYGGDAAAKGLWAMTGFGPAVRCHECGRTEPCGAGSAPPGWQRDPDRRGRYRCHRCTTERAA